MKQISDGVGLSLLKGSFEQGDTIVVDATEDESRFSTSTGSRKDG